MKTNKMLGLALLFSIMTVGLVSAQEQKAEQKPMKDPQAMAAQRAERMKKELNLTDDQATQMKGLETSMMQDRQQMQKSMQDARKDFMEKMKVHNQAMQKILKPEQFAKYRERMHRMRDRMEGYKMGLRDARRMNQRPPMHRNMHKPAHAPQAPTASPEAGQQQTPAPTAPQSN